MRKFFIPSLIALSVSACGNVDNKGSVDIITPPPPKPPVMVAVDTGNSSSWWERPQYYNNVPKYSGAFGTYTHKHIPVAVYAKGELYSVFTDNTTNNDFQIYVTKGDSEKVLVHVIKDWDDPHTNAVINVLPDGIVEVRVASRGLSHKFQSGVVLRSSTPYELDFYCVEGCTEDAPNYEAYPQIHKTSWGQHLIYTRYELRGKRNFRMPYSKVDGNIQSLSNDAHYNISYYDDVSGRLFVASNTLIGGSPDDRKNLSLIYTVDGDSWRKTDNTLVDFNLQDESDRVVHDAGLNNIYLKDIITVDGEVRVLFTESSSDDPTQGTRYLKEWIEGEGVHTIVEVGHNYSAGAYIKKDGELYIVAGISNSTGYLSGSLNLYDRDYTLIDTLEGDYSYVRRVRDTEALAVMSEGAADINNGGRQFNLELR